MVSKGRVPGRPLTEPETHQLRLLIEAKRDAQDDVRLYTIRIEDLVLECRESGASARGMAAVLDVSSSTVQKWKTNAKRRRG